MPKRAWRLRRSHRAAGRATRGAWGTCADSDRTLETVRRSPAAASGRKATFYSLRQASLSRATKQWMPTPRGLLQPQRSPITRRSRTPCRRQGGRRAAPGPQRPAASAPQGGGSDRPSPASKTQSVQAPTRASRGRRRPFMSRKQSREPIPMPPSLRRRDAQRVAVASGVPKAPRRAGRPARRRAYYLRHSQPPRRRSSIKAPLRLVVAL